MSDLVSVRSAELNHGKSLLLAILITVVGTTLIFLLSKALLTHQDFIGSVYENGTPRALAGFFLLAFPYIHQRLAGKRPLNFSHLPSHAVPLEAYALPWYLLLAYGILITFAVAGISFFLVWLVGIITGAFFTQAVSILNLIVLPVTFYYLGFWIGSRNVGNPYLTVGGVVLGYTILELLVTSVLNIDSPLQSAFGLVIFLVLFLLVAFIGARTGKRRRLLNYVHFLLSPLPEGERQAAIDDLYWEVNRRASRVQELPGERREYNRLGR